MNSGIFRPFWIILGHFEAFFHKIKCQDLNFKNSPSSAIAPVIFMGPSLLSRWRALQVGNNRQSQNLNPNSKMRRYDQIGST